MIKSPSQQQRESIKNRLNELSQKATGPEAEPPKPEAFAEAQAFAGQLPMPLAEMPHISLADDGEINFAWNGGPIYIDLGFYGTGVYSYFARDRYGQKHHGDEIPAQGPIPDNLLKTLAG